MDCLSGKRGARGDRGQGRKTEEGSEVSELWSDEYESAPADEMAAGLAHGAVECRISGIGSK